MAMTINLMNPSARSLPHLYVTLLGHRPAQPSYFDHYKTSRPEARTVQGGFLDNYFKRKSQEGKIPIKYFELHGHLGGRGRGVMGWKNQPHFIPADYDPEKPAPRYKRAKAMKGPRRCWFTRDSVGYAFVCKAGLMAQDFAGVYLRRGAKLYYTSKYVKSKINRNALTGLAIFHNMGLDAVDWGIGPRASGPRGNEGFRSNIDALINSSLWENQPGLL